MKHKIGYLCGSSSWGGLEMNQLKNALWMKERGHKVVVFCKEDTPVAQQAREWELPVLSIDPHKKYYDFKAGKKLAGLLDANGVTHLIVRDTRDISVAVIAKRKAGSAIHLSYFMEMQLGVKKKHLLHTIRYSYIDLWSCPLNWLSDQVKTMTKMDPGKVKVIPSGLDLRAFQAGTPREKAREILGLPKDKKIFGLIGRFDEHKGQLLLIEALAGIPDPEVIICLLGEPTREQGSVYLNKMNEKIRESGLEDRVFIRAFRKDVEVFYRAVDAFILASRAETFGMVTIEALACGTPVIASNAGGSPELLNNGQFGLLFEPLNSASLREKMELFLKGKVTFDTYELKRSITRFDHEDVCTLVEKALGIQGK